ncbi:hypothetical protein Tco_1143376 [Tanacetum coccineum]
MVKLLPFHHHLLTSWVSCGGCGCGDGGGAFVCFISLVKLLPFHRHLLTSFVSCGGCGCGDGGGAFVYFLYWLPNGADWSCDEDIDIAEVRVAIFDEYDESRCQPLRSNRDHTALENYRNECFRHGDVGPGTWALHGCFAGQAAQTMVPQQRTNQDPDQLLGQLVVPVFAQGTLVGVIELVTLVPKEDYGYDLDQISRLLRAENLHT